MTFFSADDADVVTRIAVEAGEIAQSHFRRLASLSVESKGHLDLVTAADKEVERFICERLQAVFPDDGIVGEEGSSVSGRAARVWVVDPIDGTFNFVRGGDQWAVSIGLCEDATPSFGVIHAPERRQTLVGGKNRRSTLNGTPLRPVRPLSRDRAATGVGFHPAIPTKTRLELLRFLMDDACMSIRCCGSATISLAEIATAQVDGYVGLGESSWDVVAALAILEPLGVGHTIDWRNTDLSAKLRFACGSPTFLATVVPGLPG